MVGISGQQRETYWRWSPGALQRQSTNERDKPRGPKQSSTKEGTFHWYGGRHLLLRHAWGKKSDHSSRRVLGNTCQLHNSRSGLVMKVLLLILLALPAMAAPKYKIQVRNQFGGWQQYKRFTTFLLPPGQHKPRQLNQASNTGLLTRTET